MKKILILLSLILSSFVSVNSLGLCGNINLEPKTGGKIPAISLPIPKNSEEKIYLGLSGKGVFKIHDIKAKVVLIKIFNLYCPICQSTASAMVELYRQIESHPDFQGKIKLIGIGAGNTQSEVEAYKQTNNIPFPLFPDQDFNIHRTLGEVRTPFFIAIKMTQDGSHEIVHTHLGGLTDIQGFLDLMYEAYGIPQEDLQKREKLATSSANQTSIQE